VASVVRRLNNCYFGAGCKVVGAVTIGDNVVVSLTCCLNRRPGGATVLGVPARVISQEATSAIQVSIKPMSWAAKISQAVQPGAGFDFGCLRE